MAKTILIVDDDPQLGEEMLEILRTEGYQADHATDRKSAVSRLHEMSYALCLLDYKMVGITGVDLLVKIKRICPQCRVVFISGRPGLEDILNESGVSHMVEGIIAKPFRVSAFLETIENQFRKPLLAEDN
ncbi:MAG: response regulator [Candidatus Omnitrophota bacterium]